MQDNILEMLPSLWDFFTIRDLPKVLLICKKVHDITWHHRKLPFLKLIKPVNFKNIFKEINLLVLPTKLSVQTEQNIIDTLTSESIIVNNLYLEDYSGSIFPTNFRVSGLAILRNHSLLFRNQSSNYKGLKRLLIHVKNKNELFTLLENGKMFPKLQLLSILFRGSDTNFDHDKITSLLNINYPNITSFQMKGLGINGIKTHFNFKKLYIDGCYTSNNQNDIKIGLNVEELTLINRNLYTILNVNFSLRHSLHTISILSETTHNTLESIFLLENLQSFEYDFLKYLKCLPFMFSLIHKFHSTLKILKCYNLNDQSLPYNDNQNYKEKNFVISYIKLSTINLLDENINTLVYLISKFKNLQAIKLEEFQSEKIINIFNLTSSIKLKEVSLELPKRISTLPKSILQNKSLVELKIYNSSLSSSSSLSFGKNYTPLLKYLYICGCRLQTLSLSNLPSLDSLVVLDVSYSFRFLQEFNSLFSESLSLMKNLEKITIRGAKVSTLSFYSLLYTLISTQKNELRSINLQDQDPHEKFISYILPIYHINKILPTLTKSIINLDIICNYSQELIDTPYHKFSNKGYNTTLNIKYYGA